METFQEYEPLSCYIAMTIIYVMYVYTFSLFIVTLYHDADIW